MSAGDDAEAFMIKDNEGKEGRSVYTLELKDLKPRENWGNQRGKRRVETNAMRGVGIHLVGEQGKGEITFYSVKLAR